MSQTVPKCDFCGRPAATFLQHVVDGEIKTLSICGDCMKKNGISIHEPESILKAFDMEKGYNREELQAQCVCGTTGEVAANGLAGCELCYTRFRNLLEAVYGVDSGEPKMPVPGTETERLQAQLEMAVEQERYEEAAALRDAIRRLEEAEDVDEEEA